MGQLRIRRTSGTAATIAEGYAGRNLIASSTAVAANYSSNFLMGNESAGDLTTHTYEIQFCVQNSGPTITLNSPNGPNMLLLLELGN